jgi:cytochrome c-type biogenesis protein CcmH
MAFWLVLALMTAAAIGAVLWPMYRPGSARGGSDAEVYRDQLHEITRDRSAGLMGEAEAEAAKVEVSRRLIAAADAAVVENSRIDNSQVWRRRWTAIATLALLPFGALAFYLALGSPQMPGVPLTSRVPASTENHSIENIVKQVEVHVEQNPDDGPAWEVLAPVYMRLGRFDDAVMAWRNTIRLNGSNGSREADYGEALVAAADGVVTAEANAAFERALAFDNKDIMARFYMGMAADQDGRRADADAIWADLIANAPPGASWVDIVRHAMARSAPAAQASTSATPVSGPSAADIAAAAKLAPDQQDQMVAGMVARLAERLKRNGSDVEGWVRLVRSYRVFGQDEKMRTTIADAGRALAGEPDKLGDFTKQIEADAGSPAVKQAPLAAVPGPSAADVNAADNMNEKDRNEMIGTMVSRLADRLKENGDDIDGWRRLLRAYIVLGKRDEAQAAADNARRALASDPDKLRQIDDAIKSLGLESGHG